MPLDDNNNDNSKETTSSTSGGDKTVRGALIRYAAHCGELLRDLESQLSTRRFVWLVVDATRLLTKLTLALRNAPPSLTLLRKQLAGKQKLCFSSLFYHLVVAVFVAVAQR